MSQPVRVRPQPIVDPRGASRVAKVSLAPRPIPRQGARILLFDNSKLDPVFGPYHAIAETITADLGALMPAVRFEARSQDLMRLDRPGLVREVADGGGAGVVFALCDSGVTQPSIVLAAEFERDGLPTVAVCLEVALGLVAANARALVPGLPLPAITAIRTATPETVAEQMRAILGEVADGLRLPPAELLRRFHERHPEADAGLDAAGGELRIGTEITASATTAADGRLVVDVDPAAFAEAIYERFVSAVMTDGFPVIPPTRDRVDRMLEHTDRDPRDAIVEQLPPSGAAVTVEGLAAAAVMAGCRPEYFPIVLTAFEAMADERYRLFQASSRATRVATRSSSAGRSRRRSASRRAAAAWGPATGPTPPSARPSPSRSSTPAGRCRAAPTWRSSGRRPSSRTASPRRAARRPGRRSTPSSTAPRRRP